MLSVIADCVLLKCAEQSWRLRIIFRTINVDGHSSLNVRSICQGAYSSLTIAYRLTLVGIQTRIRIPCRSGAARMDIIDLTRCWGLGSAQVGRRYDILVSPQTFLQVKIPIRSHHPLFLFLYNKISVTCSDILCRQ